MNNSCDDIMLNRRALWIGIVVETALSAVFLLWAWLTGFEDRFLPLPRDILSGLAGALSLFSLNVLFFQIAAPRITYLRGCVRFVDEVLKPLADLFNWRSAIFISVIAGAGEELFFRGVVQNECGLLAASVLFALVHFGPSVREHFVVAVIYTLVGLYLGILYQISGTLWVPIGAHAFYDYLALLFLRYCYARTPAAG